MLWPGKNNTSELEQIIKEQAKSCSVSWEVLASLIFIESAGNPNAIRYEPAFFRRYIEGRELTYHVPKPIPTNSTERRLRAFSFGLCQIMGQTAREFGFQGRYLTELLKPDLNIQFGAKILGKYIQQKKGDVHQGLLRYNGGSNQKYPAKVFQVVHSKKYQMLWGKSFFTS